MISERRKEKLEKVAAGRQQMTVIFENVHDPHNIGAVIRSCDAVGIQEVYVLYTEAQLTEAKMIELNSTSTGVKKWMHIHFYRDIEACFKAVREKDDLILATHMDAESKDLHELDLTQKIAFLFGNEKDGVSASALAKADGNFLIPQYGMVQSLNISVACAVTLYEALRQRKEQGKYASNLEEAGPYNKKVFDHFMETHRAEYLK